MSSVAGMSPDLDQIDEGIKQLRVAYEKYFAGVERLEPLKEREQLKKQLHRLLGENTRNTARRFRLQTLQATLVTYEQHWNRITRQIEEGTFKRDRLRAARLLGTAPVPRTAEPEPEGFDEDLDALMTESVPEPPAAKAKVDPNDGAARAPAAPRRSPAPLDDVDAVLAEVAQLTTGGTRGSPRPATRPPPAPQSSPAAPTLSRQATPPARPGVGAGAKAQAPGGHSDSVRDLHRAYTQARQSLGDREAVSIDAFAATLQKQAAAIKARFDCSEVDFKVAVKDGKAILRATPRTGTPGR